MELQLLHLGQQVDFLQVVLFLVIGLHLMELVVIAVAAAWSVETVRRDQRRLEAEWRQVLQILAHNRGAHHDG